MKYLTNDRNLARLGALTANNVLASTAVYRTDTDAKTGAGDLSLSGSYTGATDATFDVEIRPGSGTVRAVSRPVLSGVGNGEMTALSATSGVDEQSFTVTLQDLGTLTQAAGTPFLGVRIVARTAGAGGNSITITIDASGLVNTATQFSLQAALQAGQNEYIGDEWDFGAAALEADGRIPANAPRIRFGNDPQVYRPYKRFVQSTWVYSFSPAPLRSVQARTRVRTVTGSRTVTITNGVDTDTLTNIVTIYDLLAAINASSALCAVEGAVVADRLPGGQGISEASVYTSSYIASAERQGSEAIVAADFDITVASVAPTEVLQVICVDATRHNEEVWSNGGSVSSQLANAVTGVAYSAGPYSYTIPPVASIDAPSANAARAYLTLQTRTDNLPQPQLVYDRLIIGSRAQPGIYSFVWRNRPAGCNFDSAVVIGGPNPEYLGVTDTGETTVSEQSRLIRVQRLTAYIRGFMKSNTEMTRSSAGYDVLFANRCASIFHQALASIAAGTTVWPDWTASTLIAADTIREPVTKNGYRYAYSGGTTGASEPTWPTTIGGTVADGGGTWTNIGKQVWPMYDDAFAELQGDLDRLSGQLSAALPGAWSWDTAKANIATLGGINFSSTVFMLVPNARNGHWYVIEEQTGSTDLGMSEPTWPTDGTTVTDGDIIWRDAGVYWTAATVVPAGTTIDPKNGRLYTTVAGGTTGATEPEWSRVRGVEHVDNTVTWVMTDDTAPGDDISPFLDDGGDPIATPTETFYSRYTSAMNDLLAAAGLPPNFDSAGLGGNAIWRDHGGSAWFEAVNSDLLPLQPGHYYHAARYEEDEFGNQIPVATLEFGIGVAIACAELREGDFLNIEVDLAGVSRVRYQQGDRIDVLVTRAQPMALFGGQTGTNAQVWSVAGSVDGPMTNYTLSLTSPAAYNVDGLSFLIGQGAIPYALGDAFTFAVQAGLFRWRKNGGTWSADADIQPTVSLSDGLSSAFGDGPAPSWVAGDVWSFAAEAAFGVDRCRQPTDGALAWATSTVIEITAASAITGILLADHTIASTASITLTGSDDNFSTTPLSQTITWRRGTIWHAVSAGYAKYRLTINQAGSLRWLWLGLPLDLRMRRENLIELGRAVRRVRLPGPTRRFGDGVNVEHENLTQESVDALLESLTHACESDDATLGVVLPELPALVRVTADSIDIPDPFFHYQPANVDHRRLALSLDLEPVA